MKNFIYLFGFILSFNFWACNHSDPLLDMEELPKVDLTISPIVNQSLLKSGGTYNRGTAPVYIAGVEVECFNMDHDVSLVEAEFMFVDTSEISGTPIVVEDVFIGTNVINLKSIAENEGVIESMYIALPGTGFPYDITAEEMSDYFKLKNPIYAEYEGTTTTLIAQIVGGGGNNVTISMSPTTARMSFVFYGKEDLDYKVELECPGIRYNESKEFSGMSTLAYYMFNDLSIVGGMDFSFKFYKKDKDVNNYTLVHEETVTSTAGVNKTYVYSYDVYVDVQSVDFSFNWVEITDENIDYEVIVQ